MRWSSVFGASKGINPTGHSSAHVPHIVHPSVVTG